MAILSKVKRYTYSFNVVVRAKLKETCRFNGLYAIVGGVKIKEDITQIYLSKGKRTNMLQKRQTVFQSPMWSESKEKTPNSQR